MIFWFAKQGWHLALYPVEILINSVLIWIILNRLAPPQLVIEEPGEAPLDEYDLVKPVLRRTVNFPFLKCLLCSALLLGVALFSIVPVLMFSTRGIIIYLLLFFFGSRWAVSLVFEGSRSQHIVIFLLYLAIQTAVEKVIGWLV